MQEATQQDWNKLLRMMKFLKATPEVVLRMEPDDMTLHWHWDASFAVHKDCKGHTGGVLTLGKGAAHSSSTKHKLNARSSTEAEIIAVDDGMGITLWSREFLTAQGVDIEDSIPHQDNKSAILLETNGKASSSKRTRHINIRFFFVTDQVKKGNLTIRHCPTDQMLADYFTKPLTGSKFQELWNKIMNPKDTNCIKSICSQCEDTGDSS